MKWFLNDEVSIPCSIPHSFSYVAKHKGELERQFLLKILIMASVTCCLLKRKTFLYLSFFFGKLKVYSA